MLTPRHIQELAPGSGNVLLAACHAVDVAPEDLICQVLHALNVNSNLYSR